MNVFVLNTGRCGSVTFSRAASHISNFTSGHETRSGQLGEGRLGYPDQHIEADNRLSWLLGRLDQKYGGDAFYVHLTRNVHETARSFAGRHDRGIMAAYHGSGILMGLRSPDPYELGLDYCHTVTANVEMFLRDKPLKMHFPLEDAAELFPVFCDRIGADVDIKAALGEFTVKHNATVS